MDSAGAWDAFRMLFALLLFAEDPPKGGPEGPNPMGMLLPLLVIFGLFFVMVILPQNRKEKKQREALMAALKKNDEVVTLSGIIGVVHSIKDGDEVVLKIDDNAKMRVLKSSIARILSAKETPEKTS